MMSEQQMRLRILYIEETLSEMVRELKKVGCLSEEFEFHTQVELDRKVAAFVDDFIKSAEVEG